MLAIVLAACSSGGSATMQGSIGDPTDGAPTSAPPTDPGGTSGAGLQPPGDGEFVVPRPGQLDVHPIPADSFAASVDGHHVVLTITYTSGVEPCSILDTIVVDREPGAFAVTLRQGRGPGNEVCIMIAMVRRTRVDLGELEPGTYTVTDTMGGAAPIEVVVS